MPNALQSARDRLAAAKARLSELLDSEAALDQRLGRLLADSAPSKEIEKVRSLLNDASNVASDCMRSIGHLESDLRAAEAAEAERQTVARRAGLKKVGDELRSAARQFDEATRAVRVARDRFVETGAKANAAVRAAGTHPGNFSSELFASDTIAQRLHGLQNPEYSGDLVSILEGTILYATDF